MEGKIGNVTSLLQRALLPRDFSIIPEISGQSPESLGQTWRVGSPTSMVRTAMHSKEILQDDGKCQQFLHPKVKMHSNNSCSQ